MDEWMKNRLWHHEEHRERGRPTREPWCFIDIKTDPSGFLRWKLWGRIDGHDDGEGYLAFMRSMTLSGFVEHQPHLWGGEQDEALTLTGMVEHGYPRHPGGPWWVRRWERREAYKTVWRGPGGPDYVSLSHTWLSKWEPWNGWKGELCAPKLWPDIRDLVV